MMAGKRGWLATLILGWTWLYTVNLPPMLRDRRRREVASDLWEQEHDPEVRDITWRWHMLWRLVCGMPDDLRWRFEHVSAVAGGVTVTALAAAALVLAVTAAILSPPALPPAPSAPLRGEFRVPAPPPPPPPPPQPGERPDPDYWRVR